MPQSGRKLAPGDRPPARAIAFLVVLFILNSPVLAEHGVYRYLPLSRARARALVRREPSTSAIGHAAAAALAAEELGIEIPLRRVSVRLRPGDRALVLKLLRRPAEGAILDQRGMVRAGYRWDLLARLA